LKSLYRIDKIIEGFAKLIEQGNPENWKLVIGAVGEEKQSLIELTQKLNIDAHVKFVGWLEKEQNSYYYNISKYYISIPESDATSISLLEAMAAGCIPILSDLPANREWIKDGENGLIVADLNSNYIKDALKINVGNAIKINREIIAQHGTKEANKAKFIAFYEQIINQQS
jgi:glycosyltransferase involved in cell wall biosynthesis